MEELEITERAPEDLDAAFTREEFGEALEHYDQGVEVRFETAFLVRWKVNVL
jgi:hypothetical protein